MSDIPPLGSSVILRLISHRYFYIPDVVLKTTGFKSWIVVVVVQSPSHVWLLQLHRLQYARLPSPSLSARVYSNPCPLSQWCYLTISFSLCHPLLLLPSVFPSIRVFSNVSSSHQVTKGLEFQLQNQSFQWIPRTDQSPLWWTGWIS